MRRDDHNAHDPDDALRRLLKRLPKETASDDFTSRTLARLHEERHAAPSAPARFEPRATARPYVRPLMLVAAAALLLAVAIPLLRGALDAQGTAGPPQRASAPDDAPARTPASPPVRTAATPARAAELDALRREHATLERELAGLRERALPGGEVVWIGGDESVDFVLDLGRLSRARAGAGSGSSYDLMPAAAAGRARRP